MYILCQLLNYDTFLFYKSDRLAQYITVDRGQSNVISYTDSVTLSRTGLLDLNLGENGLTESIRGTPVSDVLVGTLEADRLIADAGNDVILPSRGADLIITGKGDDIVFYDTVDVHYDFILDFELNRDRLDISELLTSLENQAIDLINDGYINVIPLSTDS